MEDIVQTIRPEDVRPGMRIVINADFSINLSLAPLRDKKVPMTVTVKLVKNLSTSVVIEDMSNYMFEVNRRCYIGKLTPNPSALDALRPQPKEQPQTFAGVSID